MDFRDLIASLHAETIFPEGMIILSLLVTLLVDLIFAKNTWVQAIPLVGLASSLVILVFQWQTNASVDPNFFLSNQQIAFVGSFQGDSYGSLFAFLLPYLGFYVFYFLMNILKKQEQRLSSFLFF